MIGGQLCQALAAESIGARVTDMHHVRQATTQHQRGKSASHSRQARIPGALGMHPRVERIQDAGRRALHFSAFRKVAHPVQKAAHRGFGGDATALGAADAIGDRRDDVATRFGQVRTEYRARKVLIVGTWTGGRVKADARSNGQIAGRRQPRGLQRS